MRMLVATAEDWSAVVQQSTAANALRSLMTYPVKIGISFRNQKIVVGINDKNGSNKNRIFWARILVANES